MLEAVLYYIILIFDCFAVFDVLKTINTIKWRIFWIAIILLLPAFGLVLYYAMGKEILYLKQSERGFFQ